MSSSRRRNGWTLGIVSVALFMVVLDNLVVSVALPTIHRDLGASIQSLEWTVNAYVLAYAVLLLTGAALGDRFGRKRMFLAGLSLFTLASACAALAPNTGLLVAARAVQGAGAAAVTPLTLTLLAEAFPKDKRGMAIGVWSGISGIAVAIGPLVGGAVVQGISWHWIFWINVPIGLVVLPLAMRWLSESRGPYGTLDLPGLGLASTGAFGIVFGLVRAQSLGWTSTTVLVCMIGGAVLLAGFVVRELHTSEPMLPMSFFARRSFAVTNVVSLSMYFGMFGSIFFLSQYMQNVLGNTPLQAGLKLLVWTGASMVVAPLAGVFSERFGSRPFMFAGLTLQAGALAWLASMTSTHLAYSSMIVPFVMAGAGMALVFAPSANAVLS
ncbi:MAG: DHA2 family efflux MFS transporter permease subunit, partial [Solirubrobacteraceae bacterium]